MVGCGTVVELPVFLKVVWGEREDFMVTVKVGWRGRDGPGIFMPVWCMSSASTKQARSVQLDT